jgi:phosphate transport system permease protein
MPTKESIGKVSRPSLVLGPRTQFTNRLVETIGRLTLGAVTSLSMLAVLFIIVFITRDAIPFFKLRGFQEFFTTARWYPSGTPSQFGALSILYGSALVTLGATLVAVPLGIGASICLSDILPFKVRQAVKPVIEMLAAIPSVAYGFFALVVFAPALQGHGGAIISWVVALIAIPLMVLVGFALGDLAAEYVPESRRPTVGAVVCFTVIVTGLYLLGGALEWMADLRISSGTNALNVSLILGIMALPTVVSVSEDALQSVGRELREGSYALGATRAETLLRVVVPAAGSGIAAAVILGVMRAIGETMVVWMASGNAAQIPQPWYNLLEPVRTLTATIAGDMGEADQMTGVARYHVLFAMALVLLVISFLCNIASELILRRSRRKLRGG